MNISPLLNAAKGFLGNKVTIGASLGGLQGLKQGTALWKATPGMVGEEIANSLRFKIKVDNSLIDSSFLNHTNIASLIEKQYPESAFLLDDFILKYNPVNKTIDFEPTEKLIRDCLESNEVIMSKQEKLKTILPSVISFAGLGALVTTVADAGVKVFNKTKEYMQNRNNEDQSKVAGLVKEEIEKRAVSNELAELTTNLDLNTIIINHLEY